MQKKKTKVDTTKTPSGMKRWIFGFLLCGFSLYLLISVIYFFFYWNDDQGVIYWQNFWDVNSTQVLNPSGKLGALLANTVIGQWFGFFGIAIPIILGVIAIRIIRAKPMFLQKLVRITVIAMILGSISLGLFGAGGLFGSGIGGAQGIFVAEWIVSILGIFGAVILLGICWMLLAIYINSSTILFVNRISKNIVDKSVMVGEVVIHQASELVHKHNNEQGQEVGEIKPDILDPVVAIDPAEHVESNIEEIEPLIIDEISDEKPESQAIFEIVNISNDDLNFLGKNQVVTLNDMYRENSSFGIEPKTEPKIDSEHKVGTIQIDKSFEINDVTSGDNEPNIIEFSVDPKPKPLYVADNSIKPSPSFEIIDTNNLTETAGEVLSIGGVVEGFGDQLEIIQSKYDDSVISDEDIEARIYDPTLDLSSYQRPPIEILEDHSIGIKVSEEEIVENKNQIERTLSNFGIKIDKIKATIGPTVTLYEIVPSAGVKISKIKNLEDDIALSLKALGIRIIAPMPGEGTIGIEVPNKHKEVVSMYSVIKTVKFQECNYELPVVLGRTIQNDTFIIDLAKMPHLLVAGATGQGKSVGLNAIVSSLLYRKHPAELKFVMVDPKKVELSLYSKLERHFLAKMESEEEAILTDTQKAVYTLNALCVEMDERYNLLRLASVKKISEYNAKFTSRRLNPNKGHRFMPYIVVIIDEFADMIMTAGRDVEVPITRLAQLARAIGIHLVIATQRPDVKVITGLIKANFPARIAFRVSSMIDSRTILDQPGANQLIGRGDMLVSINGEVTRVQCAFIDTPEIEAITEFIGNQKGYGTAYELPDYVPEGDSSNSKNADMSQLDTMFEEVARSVVIGQQGSTSAIQRRFSIGYNRAGRIMDQLEGAGIVGRAEGSKPREVLVYDVQTLEGILARLNF